MTKLVQENTDLPHDLRLINPKIIRTTTNWHFKKCDNRFGFPYPGRIPGQIYINLYYFFTDLNDYILDVFCGCGTGMDAGKLMRRRVVGLDINPDNKRIKKFNVIEDNNPFKSNIFKLIVLDPPYYNMNKSKYTNERTDLSNLNLREFLNAIKLTAKKFLTSLTRDGFLALIISNKREQNRELIDLGFQCEKILSNFLKLKYRISVPYENTSFHTDKWRKICLSKKFILIGSRDLLIFQNKHQ